jgi:TetR/AcrR family transcriptional repressor of nem operon
MEIYLIDLNGLQLVGIFISDKKITSSFAYLHVSKYIFVSSLNKMNNTQEKIVSLARDFIQQVGYPSFNYKQVAAVLNIKHPAIHHYYPLKEDLGLAVIEKDRSDFGIMIKSLENAGAKERMETVLSQYAQYYTDGKKLCIIGTFGSVFGDIPEKMQIAATRHLADIAAWLTESFKLGLKNKEFHFKGTAEDMTSRWITNLPGALITGRIRGEAFFKNVLDVLRESLKVK